MVKTNYFLLVYEHDSFETELFLYKTLGLVYSKEFKNSHSSFEYTSRKGITYSTLAAVKGLNQEQYEKYKEFGIEECNS